MLEIFFRKKAYPISYASTDSEYPPNLNTHFPEQNQMEPISIFDFYNLGRCYEFNGLTYYRA